MKITIEYDLAAMVNLAVADAERQFPAPQGKRWAGEEQYNTARITLVDTETPAPTPEKEGE